jgi:uncharacterized RDD family membrane protein YckC
MKRLADNSAAIFLLCIFLCAPLRAADLLAHANDQTLWIAQVNSLPAVQTSIRYRALGGDQDWHEFPRLTGRAVDLASRGSSLAVLMASGEWLLVWPGGYSTGPALPDGAKMIALAGQADQLFALGVAGAARLSATTTTSTTAESLAASQPATAPADRLTLFEFGGAAWRPLADLPDDIPARTPDPALAVVDRRPMIAITNPQHSIRVLELTSQNSWSERPTVAAGFAPRQFQLLGAAQRPILWIAGQNDAGLIYTGDENWSRPVKLSLSSPVAAPRARAFVFAAGNLRLFVLDEYDKIYEQCYRADGQPNGNVTLLSQPRPLIGPAYNNWLLLGTATIVLLVMLGSARRRPAGDEPKIASLPLAPLSLRLLAGVIDLLPIIGTAVVLQIRYEIISLTPMIVAVAAYLAHTLIGELAMGRSAGKALCGLRVIMIDGKTPGPAAIVVRNVMRAIDLFPPLLVLILFTRLRQRMGDIVAGTAVVMAAPLPDDKHDSDQQGGPA